MSSSTPTHAQAAKACNVTEGAVVDVSVDRTGPEDRPYRVTLRSGAQINISGKEKPPKTAKADQRHADAVNFVGPKSVVNEDGTRDWVDADGKVIEEEATVEASEAEAGDSED